MQMRKIVIITLLAFSYHSFLCAQEVGAIRWDAWVGDLAEPGLEAEESMGPAEFQWKAPYYSVILDDYHILARATTQEIIDDQIKYASEAGIDYFAYLYYAGALSTALTLHFTSARKEDVKFCMIVDSGRLNSSVVSLLANYYFKRSFYKTVNIEGIDRPLLYLFQCNTNTASMIASLRAACTASGVNNPYIVAMHTHLCEGIDYDAVSNYAVGGYGGESYSSLALKAADNWDDQKNAGHKVIPLVTSGWDPRSWMKTRNPYPWHDPNINSWTVPGTPVEIANHLQDGIDWLNNNSTTAEANTILIYAWNEFSEGGWICPTKGEGDARLEEIAKVLVNGDGNSVSGPEAITIPSPTPLPAPGPGGFLENPGFESGDYQSGTDNWNAQTCTLQKVWKTFTRSGEQAIKVMDRSSTVSSPNQNITNDLLVNGQGEYYTSVYARWRTGSEKLSVVIKLIDDNGIHWYNTPYTTVSSAYTKIEGTLYLTWTGTLQTAEIFVRTETDKTSDLFLDDFYCGRKAPEFLPDLIVTDISWPLAEYLPGQEVTFSATLKNQGAAGTTAGDTIAVVFEIDNYTLSRAYTTSSLTPGDSMTVTASLSYFDDGLWPTKPGNQDMVASIDRDNYIFESDENNNTGIEIFSVLDIRPDLTVTDLFWKPTIPYAGQEVRFFLTITNLGEISTPYYEDICVLIKIDKHEMCWTCDGRMVAPGDTITIAANECINGKSTWLAEKGVHDIRGYVNGQFLFREANAYNNILDKTIRIRTTLNLAIYAKASASQTDTGNSYAPDEINDGEKFDTLNGWANPDTAMLPQWVMLEWDSAGTFNKTVLYTNNDHALRDYRLQYFKDSSWIDIETVTGNNSGQVTDSFPDVTTTKLRVYCMMGPENKPGVAYIIELEVYHDPNISLSIFNSKEGNAEEICIYPNPLDEGFFTIKLSDDQTAAKVDIFSITGKKVYSAYLPAGEKRPVIKDATFETSGLYLVRVQSAKKMETFKLIVK